MRPSKFYYCFLLFIVSTAIVLLSLSYAKESGPGGVQREVLSSTFNDLKLVCATDCFHIMTNEDFVFSITNQASEERKIAISIPGIDFNQSKVYINGIEQKNTASPLFISHFSPYGKREDYQTFSIRIDSDKTMEYGIKVYPYEEENTLEKMIKKNSSVYQDGKHYRFYGENPSNYIRYNDNLYQVIGLVDDKVKIVSSIKGLGVYKNDLLYPSLEDYIKSFHNEEVNKDNVLYYKSWMSQDKGFWLEDVENNKAYYASIYDGVALSVKYVDIYYREVVYLDKDSLVLNGDGSKDSPYEVTYESK